MEYDGAFLRSIRGMLKAGELVTAFVALVCFAAAAGSPYIAASCMELLITAALFTLYILKLNKKFTFFFWPLIDVFNSIFAAVFMFVISAIAISHHSTKGLLGGGITLVVCGNKEWTPAGNKDKDAAKDKAASAIVGIVGFMATGLWCVDAFLLFRKITFNQARTTPTVEK